MTGTTRVMSKQRVQSTDHQPGGISRLVRYAWFVLMFNVGVILVGALVRATGSGAGCGRSWPACLGELVPELEGATAIEFAHRATSGVALLLVAGLVGWVWRATSRGSPARTGVTLSAIAIVVESLIGAMIVLAEWVADDASMARVVAVPLHLVNTLFLLGALTLTIFWLSGGGRLHWSAPARRWVVAGGVALVALAATGAVTALADTLFPISGADFEDEAHFLMTLRVVHPILALVVIAAGWRVVLNTGLPPGLAGRSLPWLVAALAATGALNIVLQLPLAMRLAHLLFADVLWIAFVLVSARYLARPGAGQPLGPSDRRSSPSR
jgi:heme A synthase